MGGTAESDILRCKLLTFFWMVVKVNPKTFPLAPHFLSPWSQLDHQSRRQILGNSKFGVQPYAPPIIQSLLAEDSRRFETVQSLLPPLINGRKCSDQSTQPHAPTTPTTTETAPPGHTLVSNPLQWSSVGLGDCQICVLLLFFHGGHLDAHLLG